MLSKDDADEAANASVNTVELKPLRCRKHMQHLWFNGKHNVNHKSWTGKFPDDIIESVLVQQDKFNILKRIKLNFNCNEF